MSPMTHEELDYAIEELEARFAGMRIGDRQRKAYGDTLRPFDAVAVYTAIDRIARAGHGRPAPNEITQNIHAQQPRQRPGPFLEDDGWRDGMVPANAPGWHEGLAEVRRKLHAPTEAERVEAHGIVAQRRAENERESRPAWWGKDSI